MLTGEVSRHFPDKPCEVHPQVPGAVDKVASRLLRKSTRERYDTAADARAALRQSAGGRKPRKDAAEKVRQEAAARKSLGGPQRLPEVYVHRERLSPGDVFLLCSDGLHDMLADTRMRDFLLQHRDVDVVCDALRKGGGSQASEAQQYEQARKRRAGR